MSELRTNRIVPRDGLPSGSAGGIIQVKSTTMTTTATYSISGMTWTEVTPLTTTITPDGSNHTRACFAHTGRALGNALESHPVFNHLDSPATTSAVSYKVMITTEGSYTLYVNRSQSDSSSSSVFRTASSFTLMEVSA